MEEVVEIVKAATMTTNANDAFDVNGKAFDIFPFTLVIKRA